MLKKKIVVILIITFCCPITGCQSYKPLVLVDPDDSGLFYSNPLSDIALPPGNHVADPSVLKDDDGMYYCYTSSLNSVGFVVWSSPDMIHWKKEGLCFSKPDDYWAADCFWAPGITKHNGKYYLSFSAKSARTGYLRLDIAVSDSPLGPFRDIDPSGPLTGFEYVKNNTIDAELFFDDDGTPYIFYSNDWRNLNDGTENKISEVYMARLISDLTGIETSPVQVSSPVDEWETLRSPVVNELCIYNEAPCVLKHKGKYYVIYSGNHFDERQYSLGYAVSDNIFGPYTKYELNPILYTEDEWVEISGTGHNGVTVSPDGTEYFLFYHRHYSHVARGGDRVIAMDRFGFREDGTIYVNGPTNSLQPIPSTKGMPHNIAGEAVITTSFNLSDKQKRYLVDNEITFHTKHKQYEVEIGKPDSKETITFEFENARTINAVIVYSGSDRNCALKSCFVDFGGNRSTDMAISYDYNGQGILCFEEINAKKVTIAIRKKDFIEETAAISEICVIGK